MKFIYGHIRRCGRGCLWFLDIPRYCMCPQWFPMGESHVYPWGRTQIWLVGDRYKGNNLSKEPLIRIRQKFINENGLDKV